MLPMPWAQAAPRQHAAGGQGMTCSPHARPAAGGGSVRAAPHAPPPPPALPRRRYPEAARGAGAAAHGEGPAHLHPLHHHPHHPAHPSGACPAHRPAAAACLPCEPPCRCPWPAAPCLPAPCPLTGPRRCLPRGPLLSPLPPRCLPFCRATCSSLASSSATSRASSPPSLLVAART